MSSPQLTDLLDELLSRTPEDLANEFADLLESLEAQVADQRLSGGPSIPPVSRDLDPDQWALLDASDQTIRLIAPAGSGKTHSIVNKVLAMVHTGTSAERIVLVTFDNASKQELHARLQQLFVGVKPPAVRTLNSYGSHVLRTFKWNGPPPRLISEARGFQMKLIGQLLERLAQKGAQVKAVLPDGVKKTFYLDLFSLFKNQLYSVRLQNPSEGVRKLGEVLAPLMSNAASPLFAKVGDSKPQLIVLLTALDWLYRAYEAEKDMAGYMDFDDQKLLAYELLEGNADVRQAVQLGLDAVIVDEFQDLNELDFRLILLVSDKARLLIVGDDDQAIYGFRGTSPKYIIDFQALSHRYVRQLVLARNYRCPRNIVEHASKLIENNQYRVKKRPIAVRTDICDIRVHNALTPSAEAAAIGRYIEKARDDGHPLSEVAVLYRMNAQSLPLQLELLTRGIAYYCRKEDNIIEQDRLPRVISMLRYTVALRRASAPTLDQFLDTVRGYFRYLSVDDARMLSDAAVASGPAYASCLTSGRLAQGKIGKSNVALAISDLTRAETPLEAITTIARAFPGMSGLVGSLEEAVAGEVPLGELSDVAIRFRKIESFADFLAKAVNAAQAVSRSTPEGDAVRLLTYFRSKGTQFDTVILPSINTGIIPHARAPLEDERRLFYVAVTRTKKNLWLSYVKRACNKKVGPSQFLQELQLPDDCWTQPTTKTARTTSSK